MSNLKEHAIKEFESAGWLNDDDDGMQKLVMDNILELLDIFSEQGHSGSSAPYILNHFNTLARFKILTPLTGEDIEWNDVSADRDDKNFYLQNKRCSHVFKDETGAYDSQGKIFEDENGSCFTNSDSRVYISFPYMPKTEYVKSKAERE